MPSTSPERRARWPGADSEAVAFLKCRGYSLTEGWEWVPPARNHKADMREQDAIVYLIEEWDYGGMRRDLVKS